MTEFVQRAPRAANRWRADAALRAWAARLLPAEVLAEAEALFDEAGGLARGSWAALGDRAERERPVHVPYDAWGRRVDRVEVSDAWLRLVAEGQRIGLVAIPHDRPFGVHSRAVQAVLLQLFSPVTATAGCPLGMTDGAAAALARHDRDLALRYLPRLLARQDAWTSGQWMTEKEGGSDVSRSSTVAVRRDGAWRLHGTKWFTSATTADIALALARPEGAPAGTRGLTLFALELRAPDGGWNGIRVRRLKDKLGTWGLPTAELDLDGAVAVPVGGLEHGVSRMAVVLGVARVLSAVSAVGHLGHLLGLARDYAASREVFGAPLARQRLHVGWLAEIAAVYEGALALAMRAAAEIGAAESGAHAPLARLAPAVAKLAVTRQSLDACSQLVESFGGAGYLEDTGIPRQLRDAHVQVIWEGTSSVLARDVARALERDPSLGRAWADEVAELTADAHPSIAEQAGLVRVAAGALAPLLAEPDPAQARRLAFGLARTWQAALLARHARTALHEGDGRPAAVLREFLRVPLVAPPSDVSPDEQEAVGLGRSLDRRVEARHG